LRDASDVSDPAVSGRKGGKTEMVKIIGLGVVTVRFGVKGDAGRIKELVGGFQHWLDEKLDPNRFAVSEQDPVPWSSRAGIAGWPEDEEGKERQVELLAANFGKSLPNYAAMLQEAAAAKELEGCLRGGFPHLATQFSDQKVERLYGQGILWLEATDVDSLWHNNVGVLYASYLGCDPRCRSLSAWGIEYDRSDHWFLFARE